MPVKPREQHTGGEASSVAAKPRNARAPEDVPRQDTAAAAKRAGIINRHEFDFRLQAEWGRSGREQQPLSLMLIDVDHFRAYKDTYGQPMGDQCLEKIADVLAHAVFRPSDLVARYSATQFAILLPTHEAGARVVAARVRHAVNGMALPHLGGEGGIITVSIGVAALTPEGDLEAAELIALADDALGQAKRVGRDCIVSQDWIA